MNADPVGSAQSPAGPSAGANANGQPPKVSPEAALLQMMAAREAAADSNQTSPPPPADRRGPANPIPPAESDVAGQTDLPPDQTTPPGETQTSPEGGGDENDLSSPETGETAGENAETSLNADLTETLAQLDPTQQTQLLELLKDVKEGKASWNDVKRGHKLAGTVEQLRQQLDEIKAKAEAGAGEVPPAALPPSNLPEPVARLKNGQEVADAARFNKELKRWCERNPQGGVFKSTLANSQPVEVPEGSVMDFRDFAEDMLTEWLPARSQQLQQASDLKRAQATARAQVVQDYPWLQDPDHPETKAVRETLAAVPGLKQTPAPEYWAAVYNRGLKSMQDELASRKAGKNGHAANALRAPQRPQSKVPLGKPHSPGGAAPPRPVPGPNGAAAYQRLASDRSPAAVAAFVGASGR